MSRRKFTNIPAPTSSDPMRSVAALVDVVGYITAQTQDAIQPLAATATLPEVIAKVNAILARLQGT